MPVAAEVSSEVQLRMADRTYVWHYNPTDEPAWLRNGEALEIIRDAAASWGSCGVDLRYAGLTDRSPGKMDGENVVGWKDDGRAYSAWTSFRGRRSSRQLIEADITLYSNIFAVYREKGIDARLEFRKSIIHEFGHVLGLTHSDQLGDAMIVKVRTRPEWRLPSDNDINRCRALYSEP